MFRIMMILILSPFIILAATILVCGIIATGFEVIVKIALIAAIICIVRYVFSVCKEGS